MDTRPLMVDLRIIILSNDSALGGCLQQHTEESKIRYQRFHTSDWPWEAPESMNQHIRDYGAHMVVFTGLLDDPYLSWPGIATLAKCCHQNNAALLVTSTNGVFQGQFGGFHTEKDQPKALTNYAKRALEVEHSVQAYCPRHIIVRTGWLFSNEHFNSLTYVLESLIKKLEIKAPGGIKIAPLHIQDFSQVLLAIIRQSLLTETLWGIYHYSASDTIELLHFYEAVLLEAQQYQPIIPKMIQDDSYHLPETLAMTSGLLSGKKILYHFGIKPKPWRPAMAKTVKEFFLNISETEETASN